MIPGKYYYIRQHEWHYSSIHIAKTEKELESHQETNNNLRYDNSYRTKVMDLNQEINFLLRTQWHMWHGRWKIHVNFPTLVTLSYFRKMIKND